MEIGQRIRRRRGKLGLGLRELESRAGLTANFLSQLKNDQISPSLNFLQSIATVLQIPMNHFLDRNRPSVVVRAGERRKLYFTAFQMGYDLLCPELNRQVIGRMISVPIVRVNFTTERDKE